MLTKCALIKVIYDLITLKLHFPLAHRVHFHGT